MPVEIINIEQEFPYDASRVRVYSSPSALNAVWTEREYLRIEKLSTVAGPDIDQASFEMQVGVFTHRTDSPFGAPVSFSGVVEPLDVNRQYVKVEILDENDEVATTWFGRFAYEEQEVTVKVFEVEEEGEEEPQEVEVKTGTQRLTAYGLLWELEHAFVAESYVANATNTATINIERGIPFNFVERAGGFVLRGNLDTEGPPAFSWKPYSGDKWTADTAIDYLVARFAPKNATGNESLWLDKSGASLDWYDISIETDRRSVKQILDELVNRRRLAGYYLSCEEIGSNILATINLFTFTETAITVGADTISANDDQVQISVRGTPLLAGSVVRNVQTHVADRVVVEGGWITSTFSLTFGSIIKGWESADETAYLAGASDAEPEPNTAVRARDALRNVFSRFIVDPEWNQEALGAHNVTIQPEGIPDDVADADLEDLFASSDEKSPWRHVATRFLDYTAIKDDVTDEFRRPFVIFPDANIAADAWVFAEQASIGERQFSCNVSMLHDTLGIRLDVNHAGGNSLLAKNHWAGAEATAAELDPADSDNLAFDYEDMYVTGTVAWDDRVGAEEVINPTTDGSERVQRIFIEDARLDFLLPGTVKDIDDDGTREISSTGEVLRDDRARLRTIAAAAAQWYGTPRTAITLAYHSLKQWVSIGQIITKLVDNTLEEEVNTPITGIAYDFSKGITTIETAYAEADFSNNRAGV